MTHRINALAAIAFACLLSTAPALAESPVQLNISTRGLDLGTPAGLAELSRRIHASAAVACETGDRDIHSLAESHACIADLEQAGAARIAALTGQSDVMVASAVTK